jgi:A/G-specific adenine glycosylase
LLHWWRSNKRQFPWRRVGASRYHQIVSEVLLQRTLAPTVAAFWPTFIARFPGWQSIADAPLRDIERVLQPIGLSKQRAPRLKALATILAKSCGRFPAARDHIEALPGVGQYIANAILLFCHNKRHPLIDVNMARVLERYFGPRTLADIRYDPYLQGLAHAVVVGKHPRELNWAILDFAALVCTLRRPRCPACPLSKECYYANKTKATVTSHPTEAHSRARFRRHQTKTRSKDQEQAQGAKNQDQGEEGS